MRLATLKHLIIIKGMNKCLLSSTLKGNTSCPPPIWMMRQAGRYQKSYRKIREKHSFWSICRTSDLACQVTCTPITEFDFDVAIIFSDILVIPDALGQQVHFTSKGPTMEFSIRQTQDLKKISQKKASNNLEYVYQAIQKTRKSLPDHKALIGFSGAPFTLCLYMIEGLGTKNFNQAQYIMNTNPILFQTLIDRLCDEVSDHLIQQARSGVQALQIFDSWANLLDNNNIDRYAISPLKKIIHTVQQSTSTPIIVYSGASSIFFHKYNSLECQAISFPANISLTEIQKKMKRKVALQGNFSQNILTQERNILKEALSSYLKTEVRYLKKYPYIFNLGHGILPYTPEDNVKFLIDTVREEIYS